jgi:hypothetical protein
MHTAAMLRQRSWLPPLVGGHAGVRRTWLSTPALVGLSDSDGANWGQAPTQQEKDKGYKKTDVMTLQIKCGQLRAKIEDVIANMDLSATDAGSVAAIKALLASVTALETKVANSGWTYYPIYLIQYNAFAADWAGYGIEQATPPAAPSTPGSPPVQAPPTVVKPAATPSSPVITTKSKAGEWDWLLYVAAAAAVLGVLVGTKVVRL